MAPARYAGELVFSLARYLGELSLLAAETVRGILHGQVRPRLVVRQIYEIGYRSQLVVLITGAFTGAVFATQTFFQFQRLQMDTAVGPVVSVSMFRELGPVLCGLMVAGRVGAAMSAELGTMKVTEQLDALRALAVHPVDYLVIPRFLAMLVSMPLLVAECIGVGILAAYLLTTKVLGVSEVYYLHNMLHFTGGRDVAMGLIKGMVFGVVIVLVSCHQGLTAREGAVGVGRATTEAVVVGSLFILVVNFFLTMTLNIFFPAGK
jgi:phospholipid/cholesterol/gamma-HCH transport system permease protein